MSVDYQVALKFTTEAAQLAADRFKNSLEGIDREQRQVNQRLNQTQTTGQNAFQSMVGAAGKATIAFGAVTTAVAGIMAGLDRLRQEGKLFNAEMRVLGRVIENTSNGVRSLEEVEKAIDRIADKTDIAASAIAKGFTLAQSNIRDAQVDMERLANIALNTSRVTGQAFEDTFQDISEYVRDPEAAIEGLAEKMVTLTEAQKEQIRAMVESNNIVGASNAVLRLLEEAHEGVTGELSAEEEATIKLQNANERLSKTINEVVTPAFTGLKSTLADIIDFTSGFVDGLNAALDKIDQINQRGFEKMRPEYREPFMRNAGNVGVRGHGMVGFGVADTAGNSMDAIVKGLPTSDTALPPAPPTTDTQGNNLAKSQLNAFDSELNRQALTQEQIRQIYAIEPLWGEFGRYEGGLFSYNRGTAGDTPNSDLRNFFGGRVPTVAEIMQLQSQGKVFAAGQPQFIPGTLRGAVNRSGIDTSLPFDETTQKLLAAELMYGGTKRPTLARYLTGQSNNLNAAQNDIALEWAAFKGSSGRGAYDGIAGNKGVISPRQAIEEARFRYLNFDPLLGGSTAQYDSTPQIPQFGLGVGFDPVIEMPGISDFFTYGEAPFSSGRSPNWGNAQIGIEGYTSLPINTLSGNTSGLTGEFMKSNIQLYEEYMDKLVSVNDYLPELTNSTEDYVNMQMVSTEALEENVAAFEQAMQPYEEFANTAANAFTQFSISVISGTQSIGDALGQLAQQLASFLANKAFSMLFGNLFGGMVPSFQGGLGTVSPTSYLGGFALGAFANGGIIDRPTMALMGEGGMNEAVVPLPDGKSIPIKGNVGNNIVVNVNAPSSKQDGDAIGKIVSEAVKAELVNQQRPRGILR